MSKGVKYSNARTTKPVGATPVIPKKKPHNIPNISSIIY